MTVARVHFFRNSAMTTKTDSGSVLLPSCSMAIVASLGKGGMQHIAHQPLAITAVGIVTGKTIADLGWIIRVLPRYILGLVA